MAPRQSRLVGWSLRFARWPEVTERAFLAHKRTDRERDGAIAEEIRQKWRMPVARRLSHRRHPRQSAVGLAEGHNALF